MKKLFLLFIVVLRLSSHLFSNESISEGWVGLGANFGTFIHNDPELGDFYAGNLGLNFSAHIFLNQRNVGFFFNFGVLFPAMGNIENDFDPSIQFDFLLGLAFRHHLSEALKLYYGIGFHLYSASFEKNLNNNVRYEDERVGFGLGGDIGLKYDFTDVVYANIGAVLSYTFVQHREEEEESSTDTDSWVTKRERAGWITDASRIGIRPYIGIGFNFTVRSERPSRKWSWGKAE